MSASFTKAMKAQRKTHKERAQPMKRAGLGLLEKGKDWKLRRDDYHFKEKRLKALVSKARDRNPDEYYKAMIHTTTRGGVAKANRAETKIYTADELKLMSTQDLGYLNMRRSKERTRIERLRSQLHAIGSTTGAETGAATGPQHTIFVDTKRDVARFDPVKHFDTVPELVERTFNRPRKSTLATASIIGDTSTSNLKAIEKAQRASYHELEQRLDREAAMAKVADKLQLQRHLMGKGRRHKVIVDDVDDNDSAPTAVYRWRKERKH